MEYPINGCFNGINRGFNGINGGLNRGFVTLPGEFPICSNGHGGLHGLHMGARATASLVADYQGELTHILGYWPRQALTPFLGIDLVTKNIYDLLILHPQTRDHQLILYFIAD